MHSSAILEYFSIGTSHIHAKKGRKYLYSNEICLDIFLDVLIEGVTYRYACKHIKNKNAYTSIYKRIKKWIENNIFINIYDNAVSEYLKKNELCNLYVDSTDVINLNGNKEYTNYSFKHRSKRCIRITIISTDNKIPIYYDISKASKKDSNILENIIETNDIKFKKNTYICGDKGYQTNKKIRNKYKKRKITLCVPKKSYKKEKPKNKRKRQIERQSKGMKIVLKKRTLIENLFSRLHRTFKRINKMYDKRKDKYKSYLCVALTALIIGL